MSLGSFDDVICPECKSHRSSKKHTAACSRANQARGLTEPPVIKKEKPVLPIPFYFTATGKLRY